MAQLNSQTATMRLVACLAAGADACGEVVGIHATRDESLLAVDYLDKVNSRSGFKMLGKRTSRT